MKKINDLEKIQTELERKQSKKAKRKSRKIASGKSVFTIKKILESKK